MFFLLCVAWLRSGAYILTVNCLCVFLISTNNRLLFQMRALTHDEIEGECSLFSCPLSAKPAARLRFWRTEVSFVLRVCALRAAWSLHRVRQRQGRLHHLQGPRQPDEDHGLHADWDGADRTEPEHQHEPWVTSIQYHILSQCDRRVLQKKAPGTKRNGTCVMQQWSTSCKFAPVTPETVSAQRARQLSPIQKEEERQQFGKCVMT